MVEVKIVLFIFQFHQAHITNTYNGSDHLDFPIPTKVDNTVIFCRLVLNQTMYYSKSDFVQITEEAMDILETYQIFALFIILSDASLDDLNSRLITKSTCRNVYPNILAAGFGLFYDILFY